MHVGVINGRSSNTQFRSRLVVAEAEQHTTLTDRSGASQTFSAEVVGVLYDGPPCLLEAKSTLMFLGTTCVPPHCAMWRMVWIALPKQYPKTNKLRVCAVCCRYFYGLRDIGMNFEVFVRQTKEKLGFAAGLWSPSASTGSPDGVMRPTTIRR